MELNVKCLINICFAVWLSGGCGPAGLSRAALSLPMHNATGVHSHCIMHVRGQEAVVADGFFSTRAKIVQITPSGGTNCPSLCVNEPRHLCGKESERGGEILHSSLNGEIWKNR